MFTQLTHAQLITNLIGDLTIDEIDVSYRGAALYRIHCITQPRRQPNFVKGGSWIKLQSEEQCTTLRSVRGLSAGCLGAPTNARKLPSGESAHGRSRDINVIGA